MGPPSPKTNPAPSEGVKIENWQWSLILSGFMIMYLILGAFIFDATESQHSIDAQNQLYEDVLEFFGRRPCFANNFQDLQDFGRAVNQYRSRGASLSKEYWIDRENEDLESTWILPRATTFALTVVTTIGYGNMVPRTFGGGLFCVVYALIGIPLMGFTLSVFSKSLDGFIKRYRKVMGLLEKLIKPKRPRMVIQAILTALLVATALILFPSLLLWWYQDWPYFDSIYFFFITVTTIGFGDIYLDGCARCNASIWVFVIMFVVYVFFGMCVITALFRAVTTYQQQKLMEVETRLQSLIKAASSTILDTSSHDHGNGETGEEMARNRCPETDDRGNMELTVRGSSAVDIHNDA